VSQEKGFLTDTELAKLTALQVEMRNQVVRGEITLGDVENFLRPKSQSKLVLADDRLTSTRERCACHGTPTCPSY
jgi:hypothetical protein